MQIERTPWTYLIRTHQTRTHQLRAAGFGAAVL